MGPVIHPLTFTLTLQGFLCVRCLHLEHLVEAINLVEARGVEPLSEKCHNKKTTRLSCFVLLFAMTLLKQACQNHGASLHLAGYRLYPRSQPLYRRLVSTRQARAEQTCLI